MLSTQVKLEGILNPVNPAPSPIKLVAVHTPENTASPEPVMVAPIPAPNTPLPVLKQVPAVTIPAATIPSELLVTAEPTKVEVVKVPPPL